MVDVHSIFRRLNEGEYPSSDELRLIIKDPEIQDFQKVSLVFEVSLTNRASIQQPFIRDWMNDLPRVAKYYHTLGLAANDEFQDFESQVISRLRDKKSLGKNLISDLVRQISLDSVDLNFVVIILVLIKINGIGTEDTRLLTHAMANSGRVFDYRNSEKLHCRKVVRRYPTGALSEKIALVMPSLLMAFAGELEICSPFLVAKSLSFTGGTWDKLRAIPGFCFPTQGNETYDILRECNISMTVTEGDFNPADRVLYQLRSLSNTVESPDLIVSSIASKQLAVPADSLILDVRHGKGSFLSTHEEAQELGARIATLLEEEGIKSQYMLTDTMQPTGSSVGNYLEVLEAITLMRNLDSYDDCIFNPDAIKLQRDLVILMTVELLALQFPNLAKNALAQQAEVFFKNNTVFESFVRLLKSHSAKSQVIDAIEKSKHWHELSYRYYITASCDGIVKEIRQKEIGAFVNFGLGNGLNDITGGFNPASGVILHVRLGVTVSKGDVLATIIHGSRLEEDHLRDQNYFIIKPL